MFSVKDTSPQHASKWRGSDADMYPPETKSRETRLRGSQSHEIPCGASGRTQGQFSIRGVIQGGYLDRKLQFSIRLLAIEQGMDRDPANGLKAWPHLIHRDNQCLSQLPDKRSIVLIKDSSAIIEMSPFYHIIGNL